MKTIDETQNLKVGDKISQIYYGVRISTFTINRVTEKFAYADNFKFNISINNNGYYKATGVLNKYDNYKLITT